MQHTETGVGPGSELVLELAHILATTLGEDLSHPAGEFCKGSEAAFSPPKLVLG